MFGVVMSAHSIELLHPTDPPGPRALRLVILLVVASILVDVVVWATNPGRSPARGANRVQRAEPLRLP